MASNQVGQSRPSGRNIDVTDYLDMLKSKERGIPREAFDECTEFQAFISGQHWECYCNCMARRHCSRRDQNRALIDCLLYHCDRLGVYPWSPRECWLVGWALFHTQKPLRDLLIWSLLDESKEENVKIEMFGQHLEAWADVFESREASGYVSTTISQHTGFILDQRQVGAPWIARYVASQPTHILWAHNTWKIYRRNRMGKRDPYDDCRRELNIGSDMEMDL